MLLHLPNQTIQQLPPPRLHPFYLGASLYMPAIRADIWQIISHQKIPNIHSIILCLEDALLEKDVPYALTNIKTLLKTWQNNPPQKRPLVFIRPRHAKMLQTLSGYENIDLIDGFVLPKIDMKSLSTWRWACQNIHQNHFIMPTLETAYIFDQNHNQELADALVEGFNQEILALRVGGNDLLSCLKIRRFNNSTLYDSPLGYLLYQLLGIFVPRGFSLSSPVFEFFDKDELFAKELKQDVDLGLIGKTIIHPRQIPMVTLAFQVKQQDYQQALHILAEDAKAVFKDNNTMLEPATHKAWAKQILIRKEVFGLKQTFAL